MPIKTEYVSADVMRNARLPQHGKSYTVIPHGYLIDETRKELTEAGFSIKRELYKTSMDGQVGQAIYHLDHRSSDPEMGLMFAWSNSYNKTMTFKCAVGAHVFVCMNGMVSGDLASYRRKHTGSALYDASQSIKSQIITADKYFDRLVTDKEMFKDILLNKKEQSSILGRLYADSEIITLYQLGAVKREMENPSFNYNADPNSAWSLYNHVTLALKDSHPSVFLDNHKDLHEFFVDEFGQLITSTIAPAHTHIANIENKQPELVMAEEEPSSIFGVNFL